MGTHRRSEQRVIIAGAGPIGAILAYALRRRDIPVLLIDALPAPEIDCRAASCHPPTVAMLAELGLLEDGLDQGLLSPVFNYLDRVTGLLTAMTKGASRIAALMTKAMPMKMTRGR